MTPSEIAGRLMMLASKLEGKKQDSDAQACAEAAALILIYLDNTTGNGGEAYDRSIKATPCEAPIRPIFGNVLKAKWDD